MSTSVLVATIQAYAIKDSLGGGFRGVYRSAPSPVTGKVEESRSEVLNSIEEARFFAQNEGFVRHPNASRSVLGRSSPNLYKANLWENH